MTDATDYKDLIKSLTKKYAAGSKRDGGIVSLADEPLTIQSLSTGSLQVDRLTGIGGFPRGRISEVFGPMGSGKTTLAYGAIRAAQEQGLRCAYFDVEQALNQEWLVAQGVDTADDKLFFSRAYIAEDIFDLMQDLVASGQFGLVILDSVAAVIPEREFEAQTIADNFMGGKGQVVGKMLRRISGALAETNTALVFINHLREKLGTPYGESTYRPGGKGLDYACSLMLQVGKGDKVEDGKESIGFKIRVKAYKNRYRSVNKNVEAEVLVHAAGGISHAYDLLQVGLETGVLTKAGAWVRFRGENIANGEANTEAKLETSDALAAAVADAIAEADRA